MEKVRVLITGSNGFLGKRLRLKLESDNFFVIATGLGADRLCNHKHVYVELDVKSKERCEYVLHKYKPSVIINSAALTNVDECEKNQKKCFSINSDSLDHFIPYVKKNSVHFVQISTDFVFNGVKGSYVEGDVCDPINFYGFSKLHAEKKIINSGLTYTIIRTSLLYGSGDNNFFTRFRKKLEAGDQLNLVNDQYRTPTYISDLVLSVLIIIKLKKYGLYHISGGESVSIFDIVCNIAKYLKLDVSLINKIKSIELNQVANRPIDSTLVINKAKKDFNFIPTSLNNVLNPLL